MTITQDRLSGILTFDSYNIDISDIQVMDSFSLQFYGFDIYFRNVNQSYISSSSFVGSLISKHIKVEGSANTTIWNNLFDRNWGAIEVDGSNNNNSYLVIEGNLFYNLNSAINVYNVNNYLQRNNQFYNTAYPIDIENGYNVTITSDIFYHASSWVFDLELLTNLSVKGVEVHRGEIGIYNYGTSNVSIEGCVFDNVEFPFSLQSVTNATVTHSDLYSTISPLDKIQDTTVTFTSNYYNGYSGSGNYTLADGYVDLTPSMQPNNVKQSFAITASADQLTNSTNSVSAITWQVADSYMHLYSVVDQEGNVVDQGTTFGGTISYMPTISSYGNYSHTLHISNFEGGYDLSTVVVVVSDKLVTTITDTTTSFDTTTSTATTTTTNTTTVTGNAPSSFGTITTTAVVTLAVAGAGMLTYNKVGNKGGN